MAGNSDNNFQLGLFATNTWGALTKTLAPERWQASWKNNLVAAQMAEERVHGFRYRPYRPVVLSR